MAMQSVLCEVGNKWLNIDYFNFRLHRLTQPAIIRCSSACAGHVNNDHKNCAACVSTLKQGTGTKARQTKKTKKTKNQKTPLLGSWKEAREKSVTKSMQSPVETNHSGSQREALPGSFTHKIICISVFARYRQSHFFNLLSFLNKKRKLMTPPCCVCVHACVRHKFATNWSVYPKLRFSFALLEATPRFFSTVSNKTGRRTKFYSGR
jgi:hypothetical protein